MAPQGLSPEVAYLTDKRVVALPFDPGLLDRFIDEYRIGYLLTSSEHLQRYNSPVADRYTSRLVTHFIFEHPERYRLIHSLREDYPAFYPTTEYYVFQVQAHSKIAVIAARHRFHHPIEETTPLINARLRSEPRP